jgi:hypothetical protein
VELRRILYLLYGLKYVSADGKINDQVLLAIIIRAEFNTVKELGGADLWGESLEALSNQYYSTQGDAQTPCKGGCSLIAQLTWLQTLQGFRDVSVEDLTNATTGFSVYMDDAASLMNPNHQYGTDDFSWSWAVASPGSIIAGWIENGSNMSVNLSEGIVDGAYITGIGYFFVVTGAQMNTVANKKFRGW